MGDTDFYLNNILYIITFQNASVINIEKLMMNRLFDYCARKRISTKGINELRNRKA